MDFDAPRNILFVREKICIAKANMQARREGKILISDESLLSYLISTSDYFGKTTSPLKFYVMDETGKPTRRATEGGNSTLLFDQERALAFDYQSVCNNYDINLLVLSEEGEQLKPDEP